jgi:hypothetical protein
MEHTGSFLGVECRRFDRVTYEVARKRELDALPLLGALESSRSVASSVTSVLNLIRDQISDNCHVATEKCSTFSNMQVDDLLSLCIVSLDLLNTKIEAVADLLSTRYQPDQHSN